MNKPAHPGQILEKMYMKPLNLTTEILALHICVEAELLQQVIYGTRSMDPELAMRLARAFRTTIAFWMNLQQNYDVFCMLDISSSWEHIKPLVPKYEEQE